MNIELSTSEQALLTVLRHLARTYSPRSYLEIGVREGDSLREVLDNAPIERLALADNWSATYGGTGRGNGDHVRDLLELRGYHGPVVFLEGDSKATIPQHVQAGAEPYDLITVDGDHSASGAWADLVNVLPLLAPHGFLVFDDIAHPAHLDLAGVAQDFLASHADEIAVAFKDVSVPMGVVVFCRGGLICLH